MRCSTCRFENMPGQTTCARCGAALSAAGGLIVEFMPPRAGGKKIWYPLLYRINSAVDGYRDWTIWRALVAVTGDRDLSAGALQFTCLSVLPGLGHCAGGRRKAAAVTFLVWAALAFLAVNVFGSELTGATIGLLVGWHAVVVFDAGLRRHLATLRRRWLGMAVTLGVVCVPYVLVYHAIYGAFDFVRVPFDHFACGLRKGDVVLISRGAFEMDDLDRGDVVCFVSRGNGRTHARANLILDLDTGGAVIGRIEAREGDKVEISPAGLRHDPEFADTVAVPRLELPMPTEPVTLQIPEGQILVPVPIRLPGGPIEETAVLDIWTRMYTVGPDAIQGRALLVYQPFWRRHFIR